MSNRRAWCQSALGILASLALLIICPLPAEARSERASVQLRLLVTKQGGATQTPTLTTFELEVGDSGAGHVGTFPPDGAFSGGGSIRDVDTNRWWRGSPRRGWDVDIRVVEVQAEEITLDLQWSRFEAGSDDAIYHDSETVVLGHGDSRILDYAAADRETEPGSRNFLLEVAAKRSSPIVSTLEGELWLVHEAPNGETRSERVELPAFAAGEYQPYRLEGLTVPIQGFRAFGETLSLQLSAAGRVIAWKTAEDTLEVVSSLQVSLIQFSDGQRRGGIGGGGVKRFSIGPGETAGLEFPLPTGSFAFAAKDVQLDEDFSPGITRIVDRIQILPEKVFEGHQFWLALTLDTR